MRIIQFTTRTNQRQIGLVEKDRVNVLGGVATTYELFFYSFEKHRPLEETIDQLATRQFEDYDAIVNEKRILVPLDHPDPYHSWITGTGLTHLGSAASRSAMHEASVAGDTSGLTDSMKMFKMGIDNGRMKENDPAVQPEWFYKGNGLSAVHPEQSLHQPRFAMDGGEEPELAALYIIDTGGIPCRVGFALGNEFSDHKMERINYLYLAHSKLRECSYGPELLVSDLPENIFGTSRIIRDEKILWEREFFTGEANMSHNIANLEYHQFKYPLFRRPGDIHIHFFGTSVLSFSDGIETRNGDRFEIESPVFGKPLRNILVSEQ